MKPSKVKTSDIIAVLYSETIRDKKNQKFEIRKSVPFLKYDLTFRKRYKPQFTYKRFSKWLHLLHANRPCNLLDEEGEVVDGEVLEKELIEVN